MEILKISHLTKRFGDKEVLRGIDLNVQAGSIFGFIGQNGAGKTNAYQSFHRLSSRCPLFLFIPDSDGIFAAVRRKHRDDAG